MKKGILAMVLSLALVFAMSAFAGDYSGPGDSWPRGDAAIRHDNDVNVYGTNVPSGDVTRGIPAAAADRIFTADDLTGKKVLDSKGATLGKIKSVVLDKATGTAYVMVSMNDRWYPVPFRSLTPFQDNYRVDIDKDRFSRLPSFTEDTMKHEMAVRGFDTEIHRFFGLSAPWESGTYTK